MDNRKLLPIVVTVVTALIVLIGLSSSIFIQPKQMKEQYF